MDERDTVQKTAGGTHRASDFSEAGRLYIRLPTDHILELPPLPDWIHEQLSTRPYLKNYAKISSDQQQLVNAVTMLASEREAFLLARINRDFVDTLTQAAKWARSILRRPLLVNSASQASWKRLASGSDGDRGGDGNGGENPPRRDAVGGVPWFARWVNLQNSILVVGFLVATIFGGLWTYQKIRTASLEATISALQGNLEAIDQVETTRQSELSTLRANADNYQDELASVTADLRAMEVQLASVTAERTALNAETDRLEGELERLRQETAEAVDEQVTRLTAERDTLQKSLDQTQRDLAAKDKAASVATARVETLSQQNEQLRESLRTAGETVEKYRAKEVKLLNDRQLFELAQLALGDIETELGRWGDPREDKLKDVIRDYNRRAGPHLSRR